MCLGMRFNSFLYYYNMSKKIPIPNSPDKKYCPPDDLTSSEFQITNYQLPITNYIENNHSCSTPVSTRSTERMPLIFCTLWIILVRWWRLFTSMITFPLTSISSSLNPTITILVSLREIASDISRNRFRRSSLRMVRWTW